MHTKRHFFLLASCLSFISLVPYAVVAQNVAHHARIVDFGDKLGTGFYRGYPAKNLPATRDRDGDGSLTNDSVSAWEFSLTQPLNPPGLDFDVEAKNAIFYGGLTLYKVNNPKRRISEGHTNQNHEFFDDLNFMGLGDYTPNEKLEGYAVWFWQKDNFLNGGNTNQVLLDDSSLISVHISRYWGGVDAGRWMVRDGERFYLSKATFAGEDQPFYVGMPPGPNGEFRDGSNNPVVRRTHSLHPTLTTWAEYHPKAPYTIDFDSDKAVFTPHVFSNVTAVGFFVSRRLAVPKPAAKALIIHEPVAVKWYAFRCDAVILQPETPSLHADLIPLPGPDYAESRAFLQRSPVSYALWKQVWRSAVTRQYCLALGDLGYCFLRDGAMGAMRADSGPHTNVEPVTDITWLDAVLFCNALSELEGLTPAYYTDPAHSNVLRRVCDRDFLERWTWRPTVYWNPAAGGYRLPTPAEWVAGKGGDSTGTGVPWEYIWDVPVLSCEAGVTHHTALGRGTPPPAPPRYSCLAVAETPWNGSPRIGFRIARNTGKPAALSAIPPGVATWTIRNDTVLPPQQALSIDTLRASLTNLLRFIVIKAGQAEAGAILDRTYDPKAGSGRPPEPLAFGTTEISYRLWNAVRNWAETQAYTFNYAGDMGNMSAPLTAPHVPDEPVTMISMQDAIAWCNALSELMGRTPVYYQDEGLKTVYRKALPFRLQTFQGKGYPGFSFKRSLPKGDVYHTGSYLPVYMNGSANGYRLPLPPEWDLANQPAAKPAQMLEYEWLAGNSGGTTHPVGTRKPNLLGLYDMEGNVIELVWGNTGGVINSTPERKGSYFYRDYRARHRTLDAAEFSSVGRNHCGFRIVHRPD